MSESLQLSDHDLSSSSVQLDFLGSESSVDSVESSGDFGNVSGSAFSGTGGGDS